MLRKEDHIKIGQLNKAHGIGGEFNVTFLKNYHADEFIDVVLVEFDNYLVPFFVEDYSITQNNFGFIKFDHIHTIEATAPFVNCNLYAPKHHHITVDFLPDASSLVDYTIVDENGMNLGKVVDFIDNPNNPLLEIENEQGNYLVPLVEEFLTNIDKKNNIVTAKLPEGLINLNE